MSELNKTASMLLTTGQWKEHESFTLIPATKDCPYVEVLFNAEYKVLCIVGKTMKETFHMVDRLDSNGDPERRKNPAPNVHPFKTQRATLSSYSEYYIKEADEIRDFIKRFAVNADTFDFERYLRTSVVPPDGTETKDSGVGIITD